MTDRRRRTPQRPSRDAYTLLRYYKCARINYLYDLLDVVYEDSSPASRSSRVSYLPAAALMERSMKLRGALRAPESADELRGLEILCLSEFQYFGEFYLAVQFEN